MKILFLGYTDSPLIDYLRADNNDVAVHDEKLSRGDIAAITPEVIVSYGYRHIIKKDVLDDYPNRVINLHIAFLPWNRGADPNLWSILEDTPSGVTIHYIDEGVDTGDIIAQRAVAFSDTDTLASSYQKLHIEIQKLFKEVWPEIRDGKNERTKQVGNGSMHRARDKEHIAALLSNGWDTQIALLRGKKKLATS